MMPVTVRGTSAGPGGRRACRRARPWPRPLRGVPASVQPAVRPGTAQLQVHPHPVSVALPPRLPADGDAGHEPDAVQLERVDAVAAVAPRAAPQPERRHRSSCSTTGPSRRRRSAPPPAPPCVHAARFACPRGRRDVGEPAREGAERADRLDAVGAGPLTGAERCRDAARTRAPAAGRSCRCRPWPVTWKLLRTTTCWAFGNCSGHQGSLGRGGDRVQLTAEHQHRARTGSSPPGGLGGPAGLLAGALGHRVHQSSDCQSERAYSRTVNGP